MFGLWLLKRIFIRIRMKVFVRTKGKLVSVDTKWPDADKNLTHG